MSLSFETVSNGHRDIPPALEGIEEASVELLGGRSLLRRVDRKYLLSKHSLNDFVARLGTDVRVLRTAGRLAARYHTAYFDTPDRQMYHDHRRGRVPRYKVRARHHVDRGMSFLEIKCKKSDGRTAKSILDRSFGADDLDADALRFIGEHCPVDGTRLMPRASVTFTRATLLGDKIDERITLDWDVELFDDERRVRLPRVAVVEIKQGRFSSHTPAVWALRTMGVRERQVSKYCLATAMLAPVTTNTFRPVLLAVERLSA